MALKYISLAAMALFAHTAPTEEAKDGHLRLRSTALPVRRLARAADVVAGRYVIELEAEGKVNVMAARLRQVMSWIGKTEGSALPLPSLLSAAVELTPRQVEKLQRHPFIKAISEVPTVSAEAYAWHLDRVNQRPTKLDANQYLGPAATTAINVDVYIVDGGVQIDHPLLEGRASNYWSAFNSTADVDGHGTHCAGTAGARDYGVARPLIKSVKVLDKGTGTGDLLLAGIDQILARQKGRPAVASMSLSTPTWQPINDAIQRLLNDNVTVVAAAGNYNVDACTYSPAGVPDVITVGNVAMNDVRSASSNWGSCVDIFAPGSSITSTWINGGTWPLSGTSMAAPQVAGAAALYLSTNPTATPAEVSAYLQGMATRDVMTGIHAGTANLLLYVNNGTAPTPPQTTTDLPSTTDTTTLSSTLAPTTTTTTIRIPTTTANAATTTPSGPSCKAVDTRVTTSWCVSNNGCVNFPAFCKVF